jgi:hypothetical protein
MLAFATLGYHLYSIVMSIQEMFDTDYKKRSEKRVEETNPQTQSSNS